VSDNVVYPPKALDIAAASSEVCPDSTAGALTRAPSDDEKVGMMCVTFIPYFLDGSPHTPSKSDAYIHVRLTGQPQRYGSVTAYLPNGTAMVVDVRDLVRLVPAG
jgi:hypothetical protein